MQYIKTHSELKLPSVAALYSTHLVGNSNSLLKTGAVNSFLLFLLFFSVCYQWELVVMVGYTNRQKFFSGSPLWITTLSFQVPVFNFFLVNSLKISIQAIRDWVQWWWFMQIIPLLLIVSSFLILLYFTIAKVAHYWSIHTPKCSSVHRTYSW